MSDQRNPEFQNDSYEFRVTLRKNHSAERVIEDSDTHTAKTDTVMMLVELTY